MTITIRKGIPTNAILLAEGGGAQEHGDPITATRMEVGI